MGLSNGRVGTSNEFGCLIESAVADPRWPPDGCAWTLAEARELATRAACVLKTINVAFAIYGSVVTHGIGNDLDAIAFQLWADPQFSSQDVRRLLEEETGGRLEVLECKPNNHTRFLMTLPGGKAVDLQVWCFFPDSEPARALNGPPRVAGGDGPATGIETPTDRYQQPGGDPMRASIVIASLNEGDKLWRTVGSCLKTAAGLGCEVVVADDGSTDGSLGELRRRFPQARIVTHAERLGVSPTKDLAGRSAGGEVLVFLDGHCKPEPGALARLVAGVEATGGRAILTPAVPALDAERWENKMHQVGQGYRIDLEQFDCGWIGLERMRESGEVPGRLLYESPALIGCCLAIGRAAYERLWGFDPDMRMWGVEDLDFGLKAWLMGHPILHDSEAVVGHRFRAGFDNYAVPMEHIVANQLRMARKNFTDAVWEEWLARFRGRQPDWLWEIAWRAFEERRASVERERSYLLAHRVYDEFWYAERFGLPWPVAAPWDRSSPRAAAPPPAADARPAQAVAVPEGDAGVDDEFDDPRELFLEHYRHPRNRQMLADPDGVGSVESAGGATLTVYLRLDRAGTDGARIGRIGFQSQRCGIAVAYASLLTELVLGRSLAQARGVRPSDLMGRFGEGAGAVDSAALAVAALQRAMDGVPSG